LKGHRCDGSCQDALERAHLEPFKRRWSNPNDWPNGTVPVEGDNVVIDMAWDMIFDLPESPIYNMIQVNGWVTFQNGDGAGDLHLRCKHMYVRAGQVHIGSASTPFAAQAKITLIGEKESESTVFDNTIEAGNKVISNTGTIKMYGKSRTGKMSRLRAPVEKGATTF